MEMGECLTTHIPTKDNLSDMMTKVIYGSNNRGLVKLLMYDVFDSHDPIDTRFHSGKFSAKAIPLNMPEPRGEDIDLHLMCDIDHAEDKSTRRSRTGYLIFVNMALIPWLLKKQPVVESSVFGTEFAAVKAGMEHLRGLRYKLRMMGVPLSEPSYIYGENMSVIHNKQRPGSTFK